MIIIKIISWLIYSVGFINSQLLDECPEFNGAVEFQQFVRFHEINLGVVNGGWSTEEVMTEVANTFKSNVRWIEPDRRFEHDIHHDVLRFVLFAICVMI